MNIYFTICQERFDAKHMIAITKEEKDAIRELFPNTHIVRTMKQKSKRHRYYCVEDRNVMRLLRKMREGGANTDRTKAR